MFFKVVSAGDREIKLRFTAKQLIAMEQAGAKVLGVPKKRVGIQDLLMNIDSTEVLIWLIQQGMLWEHPNASQKEKEALYDEAVAFYEEYMEAGELDTGEKLSALQEGVSEALAAARGINLKKLLEKTKEDQEKKREEELKRMYKAQMLAREEIEAEKAKAGIGTSPSASASS